MHTCIPFRSKQRNTLCVTSTSCWPSRSLQHARLLGEEDAGAWFPFVMFTDKNGRLLAADCSLTLAHVSTTFCYSPLYRALAHLAYVIACGRINKSRYTTQCLRFYKFKVVYVTAMVRKHHGIIEYSNVNNDRSACQFTTAPVFKDEDTGTPLKLRPNKCFYVK